MEFARKMYLERIIAARGNGFIKIITGARRCGKSYLLFTLYKRRLLTEGVAAENIIDIALDDNVNEKLRNPRDLSAYIRERLKVTKGERYLFIDEIQFCRKEPVEGHPDEFITFYDVLNGIQKIKGVDIYVTGSNSKLLSKDIATEFRDRGEEIQVHPLSFAEVYEAFGGDRYVAWDNYLVYGGMPGALLKKTDEEKRKYLTALFQKTYLKDIVDRHNLKDDYALGKTADIVSSVVGSLTNPTKLAHAMQNELKVRISIPTVKSYLDYLVDSFLFSKAERYDVKGKRYLDYPSKYYAEDVGLRNARLSFRQIEPDFLMENVIYNELRARGCAVDVGVVEHWETAAGERKRKALEIDFIVNLGMTKVYIQSAFALGTERKRNQETASLRFSGDSFRKVVLVGSVQPRYTDDHGISYVNVLDFLLDEKVQQELLSKKI